MTKLQDVRVLVCGDRDWADKAMIRYYLERTLPSMGMKPVLVIEGEARGADRLAREVAEQLGITVAPFPATWNRYGRGAGPIRNKQMLVEGKPDVVIAFHDDLEHSKGTKNMVMQAATYKEKVNDNFTIIVVKHTI